MGKRSDKFKRNPRGFYITPIRAVYPLLPYLLYDSYAGQLSFHSEAA
jgi:hypothetical protein